MKVGGIETINLCHVQTTMRIRTEKEVLALQDNPDIENIVYINFTKKERDDVRYRDGIYVYNTTKKSEILEILDKHKINIVHTHNAPDSVGKYIMGLRSIHNLDCVVVHEIHDTVSFTVMTGREFRIQGENGIKALHDEEFVIKESDGLVFCSEGQFLYLWGKYGFDYNKPVILHPYVPHKHLPDMVRRTENDRPRLCFCGNINIGFLDYRKMFNELVDEGFDIDVWTTRIQHKSRYENEHIHVGECWDYPEMLRRISVCDGGILPDFRGKDYQRLTITPNKLYDYVGAGIPIVYHRDLPFICESLINKYRIGVSMDELTLPKLRGARMRVQRQRELFTMENHIDKLMNMYRRLLNAR